MKALRIRTSIVLNYLFLAALFNIFFLFFFKIDLLVFAVIAQTSISNAELVIQTEAGTNKANAETETQAVIAEDRISKFAT